MSIGLKRQKKKYIYMYILYVDKNKNKKIGTRVNTEKKRILKN